jgi:manganese oxidase
MDTQTPPASPSPPATGPTPVVADTTPIGVDNTALYVVVFFTAVALITAAVALGLATRPARSSGIAASTASADSSALVHLSEFKIEPATITVAAGGTLNVMNMGSTQHNLTIEGTSLATADVAAGGIANLPLGSLSAGTYTVFCSIAGHRQSGMQATLHVVNSPAGTQVAAANFASTTMAPMSVAAMDALMARSVQAFPAKTAGLGGQLLAPTVLADGTKQFELTAEIVKWEVSPRQLVDAWTYNGTVPGPTIKVNPGDKVKVILHNNLPESTAIHFHGLVTPNAMDGVPGITQPPVDPGQTFVYSWTAQSTPAVGMYHSHQDAVKQVPNGMAGAFLIGDEPLPPGVTVAQQQLMMLNDSGTIGLTINGKSFPATAPVVARPGDWVEVQYMNEGQMIHPMHLHGLTQVVIAKDGYPLANPESEDTVTVAPGERYTVVIHADNPGTWAWHCHILSHAENDQGMFGMVTAMVVKP